MARSNVLGRVREGYLRWRNNRYMRLAANTARAARAEFGEMGYGGVNVFAGMLDEAEWNPELRGVEGLRTLKKMVETDPTMQAAFLAMTLPMTATTWDVEPFSDAPADREVAALVEDQLFGMDGLPWADFVDECMDVLVFGFYAWEKVWSIETRRGRQVVRLRRMSARPPESITYVHALPAGDFDGITQVLTGDKGGGMVKIPASKLLWLCRRARGNNLRGRSMFRAAHKPWWIKKELEVIAAIAFERNAMGIAVGTLESDDGKGGVSTTRKDQAERTLMALNAREKQYALEVPGFKVRMEGLQGTLLDPTGFVAYLDDLIMRATLTTFIKESGGLSADNATKARGSFFVKALESTAATLAGAITEQVIHDIVRFNFPSLPREQYPKLTHGPLATVDVPAVSAALAQLTTAGVIKDTTGEVENAARIALSLPERDTAADLPARPVVPPAAPGAVAPVRPEAGIARLPGVAAHARHRLEGAPAERHPCERHVDFAGMNRAMDDAVAQVVAKVGAVQARQAEALVTHARTAFRKGTLQSALDVAVPFQDEVAGAVAEVLLELVNRGRLEVGREASLQGMPGKFAVEQPDPQRAAQVAAFIKARADGIARVMAAKLLSAYTFGILGQTRAGSFDETALDEALKALSTSEVEKAAGNSVSEAMSFGRQAEQLRLEDEELVDYYLYSALGDANTCDPCDRLDGRRFPPGSAEFRAYYPPLNAPDGTQCEGRGRCRCDMIAVMKGQANPGA